MGPTHCGHVERSDTAANVFHPVMSRYMLWSWLPPGWMDFTFTCSTIGYLVSHFPVRHFPVSHFRVAPKRET